MSHKANLTVLWGILGPFFLVILIIICIGCEFVRKDRKRRRRYLNGPTVTVTSTAQTVSPQVIPPYPIDARHPTPANNAPGPGFTTHHQAPYPTHTPNMPFPQGQTPYPPASYQPATNDYSANPPSYEVAVSQPPIQPQTKEGYVKQAPYNPGYN